MLFNSIAFLVFMPIVWCAYHAIRTPSARGYLLLAASYIFYMWWRVDHVVLLLLSTVVDYTVALIIGRVRRKWPRRAALGASILVNLGLLGTFKYWNFFAGERRQHDDDLAVPRGQAEAATRDGRAARRRVGACVRPKGIAPRHGLLLRQLRQVNPPPTT